MLTTSTSNKNSMEYGYIYNKSKSLTLKQSEYMLIEADKVIERMVSYLTTEISLNQNLPSQAQAELVIDCLAWADALRIALGSETIIKRNILS